MKKLIALFTLAALSVQANQNTWDYPLFDFDRFEIEKSQDYYNCLLYTSPSPRDATLSRMPSSA